MFAEIKWKIIEYETKNKIILFLKKIIINSAIRNLKYKIDLEMKGRYCNQSFAELYRDLVILLRYRRYLRGKITKLEWIQLTNTNLNKEEWVNDVNPYESEDGLVDHKQVSLEI